MSTFGERLQDVMRIKKIKGINLASDLKRHRSQITRWRNSTTPPDVIVIDELAENIKCDATWLETGTGEPFPDRYTPPAGDAINLNFEKKEKTDLSPNITKESEALDMVRQYRDIAKMDADTLGEIQTWINDMEKMKPGFTAWFRLEFQTRFPEFDEWKSKIIKKQANGDNY